MRSSSTAARQGGAQLGLLRGHPRESAGAEGGRVAARAERQAGGRVPHPCRRGRAWLIANSNLVPKWATWEHFNELDRKGLMMYGQMTAGSWIYIGSQGIVQGTTRLSSKPAANITAAILAGAGSSLPASAAWAARSHWRRRSPALRRSSSSASKAGSTSACVALISTSRPRPRRCAWRASTST